MRLRPTTSSTETCASRSAGNARRESSTYSATAATGTMPRKSDTGTPPTSPKRSE
ncbi:hypothetical protein GPA_10520 [Gordonibacter pamelaeae 7-10-1-b]|uniref:Uncharacterized protein n=1 Tax=Gordonibacter pamelaeae 7-10-1-b TaxID=657308 RepID=D6E7S3_9ACTN|nr:hypothetical protein GPA_10520 [Gordonibacter pamelaeae 7-10-1-b]